ncbi:SDR family NAD(P)-dependent oxidoreductase [Herpetosiphon giganteus]|uniref:SDR family NAD(P)-dependent oxidoreductase n=1 Tax=Herpetosiphon giganteus TaxID=2029754 RepID=UPI00195C3551|nr:SDR family NAD(P)-dependent oxidoreductase [Herpetosiphon giganteus]MBM7846233.1 3-oxoacyl-[acyl-carrier protein] reductase [Herpetosiphon giganteus]
MALLAEKVALITGAGRGIGAAAARLFSQYGAQVVLCDLDAAPVEQLAAELKAAGGQALAFAGDVTSAEFAPQAIAATLEHFGGLDILVNNAGYTWDGVLHTMDDAQWQAMLDVHLSAPFRLIRAAAPYLRDTAKAEIKAHGSAKARKIINVSSVSGVYGNAGQANYSAAKSGVVGLTKTLAKEWGRFNIQTNAVCYGFIETRLTAAKEQGETIQRGEQEIKLGVPENLMAGITMFHPMGRAGTPEEAAGPMVFLASNLANYVNGEILEVTGGMGI